jgi:hypothetical protein
MKKIFIIVALLCFGAKGFCQQDSTGEKKDTVMHNNHGKNWNHWEEWDKEYRGDMPPWPMPPHWRNNHVKPSNLSTNWLIFDLGFTNYNDKSNYAGTTMQNFAPGSQPYWFTPNTKNQWM